MPRRRHLIAALLTAALSGVAAQDLAESTLPLRSALHNDPTLEAPLDRLAQAWRVAGRASELQTIYRDHLRQYPDSLNARIVLLRLLQAENDPGFGRESRTAVELHADHAYVQYLRYQALAGLRDPRSLDHLERAAALESVAWRKRQWIERLITEAMAAGRPDLAATHLNAAASQAEGAEARLAVARRQLQVGLHEAALATLDAADAAGPHPELALDIDIERANAELALGRRAEAAARIDAVLARLAADHWRRTELLRRRLDLAGGNREREALIDAARQRVVADPGDEAAVLDLAQALTAADRRREALDALVAGLGRLPQAVRLERAAQELFERLRDLPAYELWLSQRLAADPRRSDLAWHRLQVLHQLDRHDEAQAVAEGLLTQDPDGGPQRLLETARQLRRVGLARAAAGHLDRVAALLPARLELQREAAEAWLAAGDQQRAFARFNDLDASGAEPEQVLDLGQFLVTSKRWREARRLIESRLANDPTLLDLQLLLIRALAGSGERQAASRAAVAIRAEADSPARYRQWIEATVESLNEAAVPAFVAAERERLAAEPADWTPAGVERVLAFVDAAAGRQQAVEATALIDHRLAALPPLEADIALRRRLVTLLADQSERAAELGPLLESLIADDPAQADDYRARLAMLVGEGGDSEALLQNIDPSRITDPGLLQRLHGLLAARGAVAAAAVCAERLTVVEPAEAEHWRRWLAICAANRDEAALRAGLRRLLAGIPNLTLVASDHEELRQRLGDSWWRSLAAALAAERVDEALGALDEIERLADDDQAWLWAMWTRAYLLGRQGRLEEREQSIVELERIVQFWDDGKGREPPQLIFPDGLVTTVATARRVLAAVGPSTTPGAKPSAITEPADRSAPLPPWRLTWTYESSAGIEATALVGERLLLRDADGHLAALDAQRGRLLWRQAAQTGQQQPLAISGDLVFAVDDDGVIALRISTGELVWRSSLGRGSAMVAVADDLVIALDPSAGRVQAFAAGDGRLRWTRALTTLPASAPRPPSLTVADGLITISGSQAAVLDLADGALRWGIDPDSVRHLQVALAGPDGTAPPPPSTSAAFMQVGTRSVPPQVAVTMSSPAMAGGVLHLNHLAPASAWFAGGAQALSPAQLRLVAPAAAAFVSQQFSDLAVSEGRVLAFGATAGLSLAIDLPVLARSLPGGRLVGLDHRHAVLLRPGVVAVLDLHLGSERLIDCSELALDPADGPPQLQAARDGAIMHIAGPAGVLGIDIASAQKLYRGDWPAGLAGEPTAGPLGVASAGRLYLPLDAHTLVALEAADQGGGVLNAIP